MSKAIPWKRWGKPDPQTEALGFRIGPDPASGPISAPPGQFRVCAYHIDWDEQPRCYVDVPDEREARRIADGVPGNTKFNVDYAAIFDDRGRSVFNTLYG